MLRASTHITSRHSRVFWARSRDTGLLQQRELGSHPFGTTPAKDSNPGSARISSRYTFHPSHWPKIQESGLEVTGSNSCVNEAKFLLRIWEECPLNLKKSESRYSESCPLSTVLGSKDSSQVSHRFAEFSFLRRTTWNLPLTETISRRLNSSGGQVGEGPLLFKQQYF